MINNPELILICCEGNTEVAYFNILKKRFRLPTYIKILPDSETDYRRLGQHEHLIDMASLKREEYSNEFGIPKERIEAWAVCDRDNYKDSFTKLDNYASERNVALAFSDPQFESFLLQHLSLDKFTGKREVLEEKLSTQIMELGVCSIPYCKGNLDWLDEMINEKHRIVTQAIKNADNFSNHTKQPFFTVQRLVERLVGLV